MVKVLIGDLFKSGAQTLVNTVNTVGVMGKGVALEFKNRFPDMYQDYVDRCKAGRVRLGEPYLFARLTAPWILNFPTKEHWRSVSRLSDIVRGLDFLEGHLRSWGVTSLAVPPLGCGQGQLEWRAVGPTLYRRLDRLGIPIELYAPFGTPHQELQVEFLSEDLGSDADQSRYHIEPGLIALIEVVNRIELEPYHWPIGRTSFQKIAYFATKLGIPTGLKYARGSYGPFAHGLKQIETRLVNNGLLREERLGKMFAVHAGETFADARTAYAHDLEKWQPQIEKLSDLFMRMSTDQAEIAASVHFVASELRIANNDVSEMDVLHGVLEWKQRRRPPLDGPEVARTIRNLNMLSWLRVRASEDLPISEEDFLNV